MVTARINTTFYLQRYYILCIIFLLLCDVKLDENKDTFSFIKACVCVCEATIVSTTLELFTSLMNIKDTWICIQVE